MLATQPILVWSFFFGLVVASIYSVGKQISNYTIPIWAAFLIGTAISYYITIAEPVSSPDSYFYLFISGFIAIIAMIAMIEKIVYKYPMPTNETIGINMSPQKKFIIH